MNFPDPHDTATGILGKAQQVHPPVDINRVAGLWPGVRISKDNILHAGYMIDLGVQGAEIIIKADDSIGRQRFTAAHELGHWVLRDNEKVLRIRRKLQASTVLEYCVPKEHAIEGAEATSAQETFFKDVERWCDEFAANLLVPTEWLKSDVRARRDQGGFMDFLMSAHDLYQVSKMAFRVRLAKVSQIAVMEVASIGSKLEIKEDYSSTSIKTLSPMNASIVYDLLRDSSNSGRLIDPDSGVLYLYRRIFDQQNFSQWIVCAIPPVGFKRSDRRRKAR